MLVDNKKNIIINITPCFLELLLNKEILNLYYIYNEMGYFNLNTSYNINPGRQFMHCQWHQKVMLNFTHNQNIFLDFFNSFTHSSKFEGATNYLISNHDLNFNERVNQYINSNKFTLISSTEDVQNVIIKRNDEINLNYSKYRDVYKNKIKNDLNSSYEFFLKCLKDNLVSINKKNCFEIYNFFLNNSN
jgi:hypothetical protein